MDQLSFYHHIKRNKLILKWIRYAFGKDDIYPDIQLSLVDLKYDLVTMRFSKDELIMLQLKYGMLSMNMLDALTAHTVSLYNINVNGVFSELVVLLDSVDEFTYIRNLDNLVNDIKHIEWE